MLHVLILDTPSNHMNPILIEPFQNTCRARRGRMVVGFTTTYAISAYHH